MLVTILKICFICVICGPVCLAQPIKEDWARVFTSEAFITEIDLSSLRFEGNKILRIKSRTIMSEPTSVKRDSDLKYRTVLQTVDFRLNAKEYRLSETIFLDEAGKVLESSTAEDWRTIRLGGVMDNMLRTARAVPPFGIWKVIAYRVVDGHLEKPSRELDGLVGSRVTIGIDRVDVNATVCRSLDFSDEQLTKEEFSRKLGFDAQSIGVSLEPIETTTLKCESGWRPPTSLLIRTGDKEMLMLWKGIFLVLKRERHWTDSLGNYPLTEGTDRSTILCHSGGFNYYSA